MKTVQHLPRALVWQGRDPSTRRGPWLASLVLLVPPIALAGGRIVPNAGELAQSVAPLAEQSAMAVSILVDHLYCFASIAVFLVVELWRQRTRPIEPTA